MGRIIYLLDTNIVSEINKPKPDMEVLAEIEYRSMFSAISSLTWYELLKGVEILPDDKRKNIMYDFLQDYVKASFPVIDFDANAASVNAYFFGELKRLGKPLPETDLHIASIAKANNMILVTRNIKDFEPLIEHCNLAVENWFEKKH